MRQFILSLLACLCLTAYSQTASQADLLVEEAQKLESKQDQGKAPVSLAFIGDRDDDFIPFVRANLFFTERKTFPDTVITFVFPFTFLLITDCLYFPTERAIHLCHTAYLRGSRTARNLESTGLTGSHHFGI